MNLPGLTLLLLSLLSAPSRAVLVDRPREHLEQRIALILQPLLAPAQVLTRQARGRGPASVPVSFEVSGCLISTAALTRYLLAGTPFVQRLEFGPACDLQGVFTATPGAFPVDLRIRSLGKIQRVRGLVQLTPGAQSWSDVAVRGKLEGAQLHYEGSSAPMQIRASYEIRFPGISALTRPISARGLLEVLSFEGNRSTFRQEFALAR